MSGKKLMSGKVAVNLQISKILLLEKNMEVVLKKQDAMQEEVKQLKDRLGSSQTCSTSQADHGFARYKY